MKRFVFGMLGLALVVGLSAAVFAGEGNSRKGKYTFRKSCRSCHIEEGSAKALSPDSKTQKQWRRLFEDGKYEKLECKAEWEKLSDADRLNIFAYLHDHAADSPTPAKCK